MDRICPICKKIYSVAPADIDRGRRLTCSIACRDALKASKRSDRPPCPRCGSRDIHRLGEVNGSIRYQCVSCHRTYYDRPPKRTTRGAEPMTNAERQRAYRERKKRERESG